MIRRNRKKVHSSSFPLILFAVQAVESVFLPSFEKALWEFE